MPREGTSGSNREAESTDAPERGGLPRSIDCDLFDPIETAHDVCRLEIDPAAGMAPHRLRSTGRGSGVRISRICPPGRALQSTAPARCHGAESGNDSYGAP